MIERAILMAERVCRYGVWASGVLVLFMAVYICIDVLLRKLFSVSIGGGEEF